MQKVAIPSPGRAARILRHRFGAAHFAKSVVWSFCDLLLAWYLHRVLHITADRIALLLCALLLLGAVCDVLVGVVINRLQMSRRSLLRLHLLASIITAIALVAQFTPSGGAESALAAGLAFRIAYALYDVPQTAMTSLLPQDCADARRYVALRSTLSAVARLIVTSTNVALVQSDAGISAGGLIPVLVAFGALLIVTALLLLRTDDMVSPSIASETRPTAQRMPANGWPILGAVFVSTLGFATLSRLLIFFPEGASLDSLGAWLLLVFSVGTVMGPLLATRTLDRLGWNVACCVNAFVGSAGASALLLANAPAIQFVAALVYGVGLNATGAMIWQAASDMIRDHAERSGTRVDALVFGLVIFTIHIAVALGALPLGLLMPLLAEGNEFVIPALSITWLSAAVVTFLLLRPGDRSTRTTIPVRKAVCPGN
jgi:Na+/melibiose symporter-like transporter